MKGQPFPGRKKMGEARCILIYTRISHDNGDGDEMYNIRGLTNVNFINTYYIYVSLLHICISYAYAYMVISYNIICMYDTKYMYTCTIFVRFNLNNITNA